MSRMPYRQFWGGTPKKLNYVLYIYIYICYYSRPILSFFFRVVSSSSFPIGLETRSLLCDHQISRIIITNLAMHSYRYVNSHIVDICVCLCYYYTCTLYYIRKWVYIAIILLQQILCSWHTIILHNEDV
jgi:hypothetical protein